MSQLFTATDVTATNGNKFIQVNTGDDVSLISPNSWIQIGNGRIQEVKTVNTSATPQTIELFYNWNGASGSGQSAISAPTAAEIKAAAEEIRQLRVTYEGIAGDVNVSAAANSIAKRDSNGRLKAAAPVASDDVVNRGYFQDDSALDAAGVFHEGNSVNPLDYGLGEVAVKSDGNTNTGNGFFHNDGSEGWDNGLASATQFPYIQGSRSTTGQTVAWQFGAVVGGSQGNNNAVFEGRVTSSQNSDWGDIVTFHHSGNTNFNEFGGGNNGDVIATGFVSSENVVRFYFPLSSKSDATSMSVTGTFTIKINGNIILTTSAEVLDLKLKPYGSKKLAVVEYGTSGLTRGQFAELIITDFTSKIIFNF